MNTETLAITTNRMNFRTLNIDNDPFQQGFESEQYDLIVASDILFTKNKISQKLKSIRKLFKPGGKLILLTDPSLLLTFQDCSAPLECAGWSGIDISFDDKVLISTASIQISSTIVLPQTYIVVDGQSNLQGELAARVKDDILKHVNLRETVNLSSDANLPRAATLYQVLTLSELHKVDLERSLCILLADVEVSFLRDMDEADYAILQKMVSNPAGVL